ncbi:MAG: hypothetical protein OSA97_08730 [Nevskia sp.]|nr:hypothetical protein [Nevskia sp.]
MSNQEFRDKLKRDNCLGKVDTRVWPMHRAPEIGRTGSTFACVE